MDEPKTPAAYSAVPDPSSNTSKSSTDPPVPTAPPTGDQVDPFHRPMKKLVDCPAGRTALAYSPGPVPSS
jgi:hypothetical protein